MEGVWNAMKIEDVRREFPQMTKVADEFRAAFGEDTKLVFMSEGGKTIGNANYGESGRFLTADRYLALGVKVKEKEPKNGK